MLLLSLNKKKGWQKLSPWPDFRQAPLSPLFIEASSFAPCLQPVQSNCSTNLPILDIRSPSIPDHPGLSSARIPLPLISPLSNFPSTDHPHLLFDCKSPFFLVGFQIELCSLLMSLLPYYNSLGIKSVFICFNWCLTLVLFPRAMWSIRNINTLYKLRWCMHHFIWQILMNIHQKTPPMLHGVDKMVGRSRQRVCSHETDSKVMKRDLHTTIAQITILLLDTYFESTWYYIGIVREISEKTNEGTFKLISDYSRTLGVCLG